jgi:hypothetical protein
MVVNTCLFLRVVMILKEVNSISATKLAIINLKNTNLTNNISLFLQ